MTAPLTIAVVGTGTDVGKTWVACALLRRVRAQGVRVAARKPVQSFVGAAEAMTAAPTDADLLGAASGEEATAVCPAHRWYPRALAPPIAANVLGLPLILLDDLLDEMVWPADATFRVVETVGGLRSPLAHDGDSLSFVRRLTPDQIVLVADAELGAINATRFACEVLSDMAVVVLLNHYDDTNEVHRHNRRWLAENDGLTVLTDARDLRW